MKTLIIYDETGFVLSNVTGSYRKPAGVPFLEIEVPIGKQIKYTNGIGVDVTKTPHEVVFENIPPSEITMLKQQIETQEQAIMELTSLIGGATHV